MSIAFLHKITPGVGAVRCKNCGSENVRLSARSPISGRYLIYRCRACGKHFKVGHHVRFFLPLLITLSLFLIVVIGFIASWYGGAFIEDDTNSLFTFIQGVLRP